MELGGSVADGVNNSDHCIDGIAANADGDESVCWVDAVGFNGGVGCWQDVLVKVVKVCGVLVREATEGGRVDLSIVSLSGFRCEGIERDEAVEEDLLACYTKGSVAEELEGLVPPRPIVPRDI